LLQHTHCALKMETRGNEVDVERGRMYPSPGRNTFYSEGEMR